MPWTIYRYILRDLLQLFVIAATVLVLVISMAAAIQPLSQGLLGPAGLLRFIYYTAPAMLQFAVPFAGAYAAVVTFCRLSSDNEILACCAGGISYRAIMLPVIFIGLAMTLGLFYMSNWVVPRFYRDRQQLLLTEDPRVMIDLVSRGQPFRMESWVVYADGASEASIPPEALAAEVPPLRRLMLDGVAASQLGEAGRLLSEMTAQRADAYLFRYQGAAWITMRLTNVMVYQPGDGVLVASDEIEVSPQRLLSGFKDDPLLMTWPQLRELGSHPEHYDRVQRAMDELRQAMVAERLLQVMAAKLRTPTDTRDELPGVWLRAPRDEQYRITAPQVERRGDALLLSADADQRVHVDHIVDGSVRRSVEAQRGSVSIQISDAQPQPTIQIELAEAQVHDARTGASTGHPTLPLLRARWPEPILEDLPSDDYYTLVAAASVPTFASATSVKRSSDYLAKHVQRVIHRAIAQLNVRAANAVSAVLVLMLAAVMAIRQRDGMILAVFWSVFAVTIIAIFIVQGGHELATRPGAHVEPGLALLWLGDVLLLVLVAYHYAKLSRH